MNTMTSPEKQKLYIVMCIGCLECGNDSRVLATCKTWEEASDIAYQKSKTDDYASSIDLHQITVWDQCPNLLDFVHNQLATNPYEIPADILVSINSFKAAYDARRLAQTQIVPQLAAATGPVVYSWTSPILTPVAPTYNLTTGVLTLGTPKAKHKIPENANRDICKECGRKTKEVALFTTTTHYCPDCE